MTLIEARRICKQYGSRSSSVSTALEPTSLRVEQGEYVSIVGPSGSGKSTLMNLLGLLDRPTFGLLFFSKIDCGRLNDDQRATIRNRRIGFIFQAYHLLPRLCAWRNVELPLIYGGIHGKDRCRLADRALDAVGLLSKRNRLPTELSGGEQQRVAIARAIVRDPPMLLADEPTGALDTAASRVILSILRELNRSGRTIILVTHDFQIASEATRTLCMRDGQIVADGRPQEVVSRLQITEAAA